ncbi:MAG TPA: NfeD family protein [Micromonosporaceae bacterium]|nr:NfeD family protein [Micromonosporaceae bacterium]
MTTTFLIVGGFGLFLLAPSLVFGGHVHVGHLHLHVPFHLRLPAPIHLHAHVGHAGHAGHSGADAALSLPSIAGFIGAFGFGGAIAAQLTDARTATVPVVVGLAAALPTAWLGARLTRAAMDMRTDATPTQSDVIGTLGVVIQQIPADGYGEVRIRLAGQLMKFHARAADALPAGTPILVIDAPSSTSVVVEATTPALR